MKKTYLLTVDYDKTKEGICEIFGTTVEKLAMFQIEILKKGDAKTFTGALIESLETDEVDGGIILALATMTLCAMHREAADVIKMLKCISGIKEENEN